jgi:hypothetical protein
VALRARNASSYTANTHTISHQSTHHHAPTRVIDVDDAHARVRASTHLCFTRGA